MFAISIIATAGIHYGAAQKGAVAAFKAGGEGGDAVIPGSGFVQPASLATIIGGIIFGIGMIFGGCCASGTLTDVGEGEARAWIVVPFFGIGGGIIGAMHSSWWKESVFEKAGGVQVYLPDVFGYIGAVLVSLILLLLIYIFTKKNTKKKKAKRGNLYR